LQELKKPFPRSDSLGDPLGDFRCVDRIGFGWAFGWAVRWAMEPWFA
jgi:hypothetical protein